MLVDFNRRFRILLRWTRTAPDYLKKTDVSMTQIPFPGLGSLTRSGHLWNEIGMALGLGSD